MALKIGDKVVSVDHEFKGKTGRILNISQDSELCYLILFDEPADVFHNGGTGNPKHRNRCWFVEESEIKKIDEIFVPSENSFVLFEKIS